MSTIFKGIKNKLSRNRLAIIPIEGPIVGDSSSGGFSSLFKSPIAEAEEYIDKVMENDRYKAVIFQINSPGGSPYKSKEISDKIQKMDKPTIACIGELGASGAYWIASACDRVYADKLSTVGGIGTLSIRPDFSELLKKIGIEIDVESKGKYKQFGMPFAEPTEEEKEVREKVLNNINNMFTEHVKQNRKINDDGDVFEGKVYLGEEALEVGLIDQIAGIEKAIETTKKETNKDLTIIDYNKKIGKGPSIKNLFK
ncbi:Periplasmic serine protease ClpP class [Methanonatronarchaeum thermophilum]|uniref:Periplasmic serine protease ClpP class n=1 Tax=Methanonatronarchaeum thermophilum TaxID=1927129 RepID=A0A1Y3GDU8_9EURY|nr:S49 family peptidase [Methanonatronarchaeum thermophilum]OUJ19397.1 Periplasmic serine protease ClpP class [Methanonatronarchaeum thermophilum]